MIEIYEIEIGRPLEKDNGRLVVTANTELDALMYLISDINRDYIDTENCFLKVFITKESDEAKI